MAVGVMQPYLFPYIGYFQLINAVNYFVFYDDVNYIKQGWINRNRWLINGQPQYFNVNLDKASSNKLIQEIQINESWNPDKLLKTLVQNYKQAPNFEPVYNIVHDVLVKKYNNIAQMAANSVEAICRYVDIDCEFHLSSELPIERREDRTERLFEMTRHFGQHTYVNMIGGKELYHKSDFEKVGLNLNFLQPKISEYQQLKMDEFIPGLSIIDVLMNCSKEEVNGMLKEYRLVK